MCRPTTVKCNPLRNYAIAENAVNAPYPDVVLYAV
jgi:hypothetical protein